MSLTPRLLLLLGIIAVSFAAIFIRLADAPPLIIAAYRLGIASLLILPFTHRRMITSVRSLPRRESLLIILAGIFLAAHFVLWITSLQYTSIASSVILVTAHPVFVAVASYFLWKERLNRLSIAGIVIALAGVVIIGQGEFSFGSEVFLGNAMALVAGLLASSYLMVARALKDRIDAVSYLSSVYGVAAIILVTFAVIAGLSFTGYTETTYLMLLLLAVIPQLLGHSSFNMAARVMPVTLVSVAILGEPVGATLLGIIILGEWPSFAEVIGGLVILTGIYCVLRGGRIWLQAPG
ncbi:DMT family transporter [Dehalogenimonas sp. THU2]|uniref:DMT family transporter n=1 Tax=Dehalogenimonas sp. THU2 TaxID=3151121 RepID=UPI003218366A